MVTRAGSADPRPSRYGRLMSDQPSTAVIVDDAVEVRLLVKHQLGLSGRFVVVGEGATGQEAIEQVRRHRPDLLLLDVSMPDMDGLEALPHVRAASPETVVVMYTGFDEGGLAARAQSLGAAALIEKSAAIDDLPEQLEAIVRVAAPVPARAEGGDDDVVPTPNVLDEHLERFREIFEEAAIGMATMTLTGNVVRPNRALAAVIGRPIAELVGLPYVQLAAPPDAARVTAQLLA